MPPKYTQQFEAELEFARKSANETSNLYWENAGHNGLTVAGEQVLRVGGGSWWDLAPNRTKVVGLRYRRPRVIPPCDHETWILSLGGIDGRYALQDEEWCSGYWRVMVEAGKANRSSLYRRRRHQDAPAIPVGARFDYTFDEPWRTHVMRLVLPDGRRWSLRRRDTFAESAEDAKAAMRVILLQRYRENLQPPAQEQAVQEVRNEEGVVVAHITPNPAPSTPLDSFGKPAARRINIPPEKLPPAG